MKHVAILDDYQNLALTSADWSTLKGRAEIDRFSRQIVDEDALVEALGGYEVMVALRERTRFTRSLMSRLPNLELIVSIGPITAAIDFAAAASFGIKVSATRGYLPPTMEHTWALILACAKRVVQCDREIKNGLWLPNMTMDLEGTRLGIIGLGNLGFRVAQVAKAFKMDLVAFSQNLTDERCRDVGAAHVSKEELLSTSDIVSIHLRLSDRTTGLLGAADLRRMKPSAYLINTSRGPIVDEPALVDALKNNWIAGAGLDVFSIEPLPAEHPLRHLENVVTTPHTAHVTPRTYRVFYEDAVENIAAYVADGTVLRPAEEDPTDASWWDV
jgi:phosphoglycerate dehydrogenase-like enzyme